MRRKHRLIAAIFVLALVLFAFPACRSSSQPKAEPDEIMIRIKLNLDEDIGLFLVYYDVNGTVGAGGISNADKSLLKCDSDDLYWSFYQRQLTEPEDSVRLALSFVVVTEYFDPNFENEYPEEYQIPLETVYFDADFGKIYTVMVSGSRDSGYQAALEETEGS